MKRYAFPICAAGVALLAAACASSSASSAPSGPTAPSMQVAVRTVKNSGKYAVTLRTDPAEVKSGQSVKLAFSVVDGSGKPVRDLDIVHEMPMHLIVVSEDLSYFDHIHPMPQPDGSLVVETAFPAAGKYKLYSDYTPKGGGNQVGQIEVTVSGTPREPSRPTPDTRMTKDFDGLRVTFQTDKPLRANDAVMLRFDLADARTGKPVTDLQPYLGAMGHFVVISQNTDEYLHVHPMEPSEMKKGGHAHGGDMKHAEGSHHAHGATPAKGGPSVSAHTSFPKPGIYKIWGQFKRNDRIVTTSFVVDIADGSTSPAQTATVKNGKQEVVVTVTSDGYQPATLSLKGGVPARVIFRRTDAENCGDEVVFAELDIRKKLPVGKDVVVEFTPEKDKTYVFTCGMKMLRGSIAVQ
jgi:hypothetical protein